jgi:DNA replication protein DnaC
MTGQTKIAVCETHGEYESNGCEIPLLGRMRWSGCPACDAEKRERADAVKAAERNRVVQQRRRDARIPLHFDECSFENYEASTGAMQHALKVAGDFAATLDERHAGEIEKFMLVLMGGVGTGKTHLGIAIASAAAETRKALYVDMLEMVQMVRVTWRRGSDVSESGVLRELATVGLLVIDEVGVQYGTDAEKVTVFEILNSRYRNKMPTVLISNLGADGMKDFLGERVCDRLAEVSERVVFGWKSFRGANK